MAILREQNYSSITGNVLTVANGNLISTKNSTQAILGAGEEFTGEWEDVTNFTMIYVSLRADANSATDGLLVEYTDDISGTPVIISCDEYTILADFPKTFSGQAAAKYYRVRYINGATPQTQFNLQTSLKQTYGKSSSHRIQDAIVSDDDAELVKAVLTAKANGHGFTNITATASNNLRVTDAESGLAIAKGDVVGTTYIHKFGNAPNFDAADGEITVWDGAEDGTAWENMVYDYSATADIDSISSSDITDTQEITVIGLDTDWNEVSQIITLTGQTRVALPTPLIRAFRAFNSDSVDLVGHVIIYVNTAISGGVPTDTSKIRAVIDPINQQTEMAVYSIPAGKKGYMRSWYATTAGSNKSSNYNIKLKSREFGRVFRLKHISALSDNATSCYLHQYVEPLVFLEKTDIEMRVQMLAAGATGGSFSAGFDIVIIDD